MFGRSRPKPPPIFQQCEHCEYDFATDEGERSCDYLQCPYLPDILDVKCPTCLFNFYTNDGNPACGDPPDCDFARQEAPIRVAALQHWLETGQLPTS